MEGAGYRKDRGPLKGFLTPSIYLGVVKCPPPTPNPRGDEYSRDTPALYWKVPPFHVERKNGWDC